jgi:mono/diheme cytochrome c family protein
MTRSRPRVLWALLMAMTSASCGSARRGAPLIGERHPTDPKLTLGEQMFDRNCSQCHPGGEAGLGPALNDKPLPQFAVRIQVRNGVGAMPRFRSTELSDEQLRAVMAYMVWLRRQR